MILLCEHDFDFWMQLQGQVGTVCEISLPVTIYGERRQQKSWLHNPVNILKNVELYTLDG